MNYEFSYKNNDGNVVKLSVKAKNGKVRTMLKGAAYTLDGLLKLAATGELSDEELADNAALQSVSQATAKEWVEAAAIGNSDHLEVVEVVEVVEATPEPTGKK